MKTSIDDAMDILMKTCVCLLCLMAVIIFSLFAYNLIIDPAGIMCKKEIGYQIIRMDYKNE